MNDSSFSLKRKHLEAQDEESILDRRKKPYTIHQIDIANNQRLTALEWNAGETPISAWLNQSAIPQPSAIASLPEVKATTDDAGLLQQEEHEIERYKYVHVATLPGSSDTLADGLVTASENVADLGLDAQIYYRNIVDRFPKLPVYLARRLAIANQKRAERLHVRRMNACQNPAGVAKAAHRSPTRRSSQSSRPYAESLGEKVWAKPSDPNPRKFDTWRIYKPPPRLSGTTVFDESSYVSNMSRYVSLSLG